MMKRTWLNACVDLACSTSRDHFWSGARKIFPDVRLDFGAMDSSITMEDAGYTQYKMTRLHDQYFVNDAVTVAMMLHEKNCARKKYASAAFHTYGHLLKATYDNRSTRGSVMGPCVQSVVMTLRPHQRGTFVDVFYRTTELCKKFVADLVWLHDRVYPLIPCQEQFPILRWRFHFVNLTMHPMYFPTLFPHVPDAIATLERIRANDPAMHEWILKWTARYIIGGEAARSIDKFAQAKRTADAANALISGDTRRALLQYLSDNRHIAIPKRSRFDTSAISKAFDEAIHAI